VARGGVKLQAKVVVTKDDFDGFEDKLEEAVKSGLRRTALEAAVVARGVNTRGYRIQHILSSTKIGLVQRTFRGFELVLGWTDFRANFFNKGTYQRKGALAKGGDPPGPNRGVRPIRFMTAARAVARKRLLMNIKKAAP
jgi:hypothetical protein